MSGIFYLGSHPSDGMAAIALSYVAGFTIQSFSIFSSLEYGPASLFNLFSFSPPVFWQAILIRLLLSCHHIVQENVVSLVGLTFLLVAVFLPFSI